METLAELHSGVRAAVVSAYQDGVATSLYGLLNADPTFNGAKLEAGLRDLAVWTAGYEGATAPSVEREFYYPGTRHGALVVDALSATPGLVDFLDKQLSGDAMWATVEP